MLWAPLTRLCASSTAGYPPCPACLWMSSSWCHHQQELPARETEAREERDPSLHPRRGWVGPLHPRRCAPVETACGELPSRPELGFLPLVSIPRGKLAWKGDKDRQSTLGLTSQKCRHGPHCGPQAGLRFPRDKVSGEQQEGGVLQQHDLREQGGSPPHLAQELLEALDLPTLASSCSLASWGPGAPLHSLLYASALMLSAGRASATRDMPVGSEVPLSSALPMLHLCLQR